MSNRSSVYFFPPSHHIVVYDGQRYKEMKIKRMRKSGKADGFFSDSPKFSAVNWELELLQRAFAADILFFASLLTVGRSHLDCNPFVTIDRQLLPSSLANFAEATTDCMLAFALERLLQSVELSIQTLTVLAALSLL